MTEDIGIGLMMLERAMAVEREGRGFYLKAAQTTHFEKGRETFTTLAENEQKHYNFIRRQHDALTREGRWIGSPEMRPVEIDL